jgi:hypothetical protein
MEQGVWGWGWTGENGTARDRAGGREVKAAVDRSRRMRF